MDIVVRGNVLVEFTQVDQCLFLKEIGQKSDAVGQTLFAQSDRHAECRMTGKVGDGQLFATKAGSYDHIIRLYCSIHLLHEDSSVTIGIDIFHGRDGSCYSEIIGPIESCLPGHLIIEIGP